VCWSVVLVIEGRVAVDGALAADAFGSGVGEGILDFLEMGGELEEFAAFAAEFSFDFPDAEGDNHAALPPEDSQDPAHYATCPAGVQSLQIPSHTEWSRHQTRTLPHSEIQASP
jgi:hypothetical protein